MQNTLQAVFLLCLASGLSAQQGDHWQQVGTEVLRSTTSAQTNYMMQAIAFDGIRILMYGGRGASGQEPFGWKTGGAFNIATDTWETRPNLQNGVGAPSARAMPVGVWTGDKFVVWGGSGDSDQVAYWDGGVYDPLTDTWLSAPRLNAGVGAPIQDIHPSWGSQPHGAARGLGAWTGDRMLVYGGESQVYWAPLDIWWPIGVFKGGMYDPVLDLWDAGLSLSNQVLPEQFNHGLAWTGKEMYGRGGGSGVMNLYPQSDGQTFKAGDIYDPVSDTWLQVPSLRTPPASVLPTAFQSAWLTGTEVIEWGGVTMANPTVPSAGHTATTVGYRFNLADRTFISSPSLYANTLGPIDRVSFGNCWTGSHVVIVGGARNEPAAPVPPPWPRNGFLYHPDTDQWSQPPGLNDQQVSPYNQDRVNQLSVWTGDRLVIWGGFRLDNTNWPPVLVPLLDGGVYHPPRVAPTVRNLAPADPGASAANPLTATVGGRFKHRIVCYGTPEAALISSNLPSWLNIGFGGPGPLVAVGTGQGNGGQNGNPPGTGAPFSPWFSAEGLTADGQWLHGTPQVGDAGLHSFTIHAHNGVHPDTATYTVWIEVIIPPGPPSFTTPVPPSAAIAGELYTAPVAAVGPPPVTSIQLTGHPWLNYSNGIVSGIPPVSAGGTTQGPFTLTASNGHPPDATQLFSLTVAHAYTDTNRDRAVNVTDVQLTVNIILGLTQPQWPEQGDANRDSVVNVIDVQQVVNKILNP